MTKTVRLTKHIKQRIRRRLIDHAFKEREKANARGFYELADAVYHDLYPEALRKQMDAMPNGFLPEDTDVSVCFERVERFARDFLVSAQSGTLPALPIGDLNKRLGLETAK